MATIEQVTETITQEVFVLKYTRAELEDFAAKPQRYLNDILDVLDGSNKPPLKRAVAKPAKSAKKPAAAKRVDQFKTYKCPICKRAFKTQGWLNQHQASVHDSETEIGSHKIEASDD